MRHRIKEYGARHRGEQEALRQQEAERLAARQQTGLNKTEEEQIANATLIASNVNPKPEDIADPILSNPTMNQATERIENAVVDSLFYPPMQPQEPILQPPPVMSLENAMAIQQQLDASAHPHGISEEEAIRLAQQHELEQQYQSRLNQLDLGDREFGSISPGTSISNLSHLSSMSNLSYHSAMEGPQEQGTGMVPISPSRVATRRSVTPYSRPPSPQDNP